ncbi:hypothetical protein ABWH91_11080 [Phycisphaerales bacterium ac7]
MTIREHISQVNAHSGFKNAETDEVLLHRVLAGCKLARDAAERSSVVDQLSRAEDSLLLSIQRINECLHRSAFYGEGDSALREACYAISSVIDLYLATGKELIRRGDSALGLRVLDGARLVHLAFDAILAGDIEDVFSHAKQEFAIRSGN